VEACACELLNILASDTGSRRAVSLDRVDREKSQAMSKLTRFPPQVQVVDLVLDPFGYQDTLRTCVQQGQLNGKTLAHLEQVLPLAIAQLDAVGDIYGALALEALHDQLMHQALTA
jgi:hypothetical protein